MDKLQIISESYIDSITTFFLESCQWFLKVIHSYLPLLFEGEFQSTMTAAATSFALITAAEMGDKSQLVCMALAAKHRPIPVIFGASFAFALLNTLAVGFGAVVASWFPKYLIAATVAILFAAFGVQALRTETGDAEEDFKEKSGHGIMLTTFFLITVAEFGDKTQLAVVALSSTYSGVGVWLGATTALVMTSAMGVLAGRKLMKTVPIELLHKLGGILFLMLSLFAGLNSLVAYQGYEMKFEFF
jgi:putative Ca2+/H+ antiporter (TMEM165/GDT1 family)